MFRKRNRFTLLGASVLTALLIAGCGANETDASNDAGEAAAPPVAENGGEQTVSDQPIRIAMRANPNTLDPHHTNDNPSATINQQIFSTLVVQDEALDIVPGLAYDWTFIDDLTIEFNLRDDVYFHNGEKLTAADVDFSLRRAWNSGQVSHIVGPIDPEGIEIIDDYTIRVSTSEPFAPLLAHLAHVAASILNEKAVEEAGEFVGQNPVGTGPFVFENWVQGTSLTLSRNENYFGETPLPSGLEFSVIVESNSRVIELETGAVDVILDVAPSDIARIVATDGLVLHQEPNLRINYVGINTEVPPFDQVEVRQALNYAIDTRSIIEFILEGVGEFATGPIGSNIPGFNADLEGYEFNPERARELLAEAGFPDGFETEILIDDDTVRTALATVIRNQLEEVGIVATIRSLDWATYIDETAAGNHELFILGWTTVTADADYGLFPLFHTSTIGPGGNRSFFSYPRLDELLDQGRASNDAAARLEIYAEAQEIIVYQAPWIFLYADENIAATRDNVQNFILNPAGTHRYARVTTN